MAPKSVDDELDIVGLLTMPLAMLASSGVMMFLFSGMLRTLGIMSTSSWAKGKGEIGV